MGRLSNRFSIGNRLARLSTNWGLPDALARLGLADPSAPLHPAPHQGPPQPSPIAEEGNAEEGNAEEDEAAVTAPASAQSASHRVEIDTELQQQQLAADDIQSRQLSQQSSLRGGRQLPRQSVHYQKHAARSAAPKPSPQPTAALQEVSDDSSSAEDQGTAATQLPAQANDGSPPGRNATSRAAFASLGNAHTSPVQGELRGIA